MKKMSKLLITLCLLGFCIESGFGLQCYFGFGTNVQLTDCGSASDKCVYSRVNDFTVKSCYSTINSTNYSAFSLGIGCQKVKVDDLDTEICICRGDKCNGGGFEDTDLPDTASEVASTAIHSHPQPITTERSGVGVQCYVGVGSTNYLINCGTASDKCVRTRVKDVTANVCYSEMKWSAYPGFTPTDGCQNVTVGDIDQEICICTGDKCNGGGFEDTSQRHNNTKLEPTTPSFTNDQSDFGVECYVGVGTTTFSMGCGARSDKCVRSRVNDVLTKACYNQMKWSEYPGFTPTLGCHKHYSSDRQTEICICSGDQCNTGDFYPTKAEIEKARYNEFSTTMESTSTSGVGRVYASTMILFLLNSISCFLLQ